MKRKTFSFLQTISLLLLGLLLPSTSFGAHPVPFQVYFQEPVTPVMHQLIDFHNLLLTIITAICVFVLLLLVYVVIRYNEKMNPVPSKTTHNTVIEVVWTAIPVIILLFIAFPSIKLLYFMDSSIQGDMTVKITGNQWYWTYAYPDHDNVEFESRIIPEADLKPGQIRLLEVDNRLVVPTNTKIKFIITASDVLHSWAMPSFGIKRDAVPGRLNEAWAEIEKEGVYYGQCSEICGKDHGFMPIAVQAVPKDQFDSWIQKVKDKGDYQEFKSL